MNGLKATKSDIVRPFRFWVNQVLQYHYESQRSVKYATLKLFSIQFFPLLRVYFCASGANSKKNSSKRWMKVERRERSSGRETLISRFERIHASLINQVFLLLFVCVMWGSSCRDEPNEFTFITAKRELGCCVNDSFRKCFVPTAKVRRKKLNNKRFREWLEFINVTQLQAAVDKSG